MSKIVFVYDWNVDLQGTVLPSQSSSVCVSVLWMARVDARVVSFVTVQKNNSAGACSQLFVLGGGKGLSVMCT